MGRRGNVRGLPGGNVRPNVTSLRLRLWQSPHRQPDGTVRLDVTIVFCGTAVLYVSPFYLLTPIHARSEEAGGWGNESKGKRTLAKMATTTTAC